MSFSEKNMNLFIGLFSLLVALWLVMFAVPDIFVKLFDTPLGNLFLIGFIIMAIMHNIPMGVGLAIIFIVLFRFSHMSHANFASFKF